MPPANVNRPASGVRHEQDFSYTSRPTRTKRRLQPIKIYFPKVTLPPPRRMDLPKTLLPFRR
jgi:hypothetical protein